MKGFKRFIYSSFAFSFMFFYFGLEASAAQYALGYLPVISDNPIVDNDDETYYVFDKPQIKELYNAEALPLFKYVYLDSSDMPSALGMKINFYNQSGTRIHSLSLNQQRERERDKMYIFISEVGLSGVTRIEIDFTSTVNTYNIHEFDVLTNIPDSVSPGQISNVSHVFNEDNSVTYQYDFPTDSDFSHLEIYQDGLLLNDNYKLNTITITDLEPEKPYNFKFVSVDSSGNKSTEYVSSVVAPSGPDLIAPLDVTDIKQVVSGTGIQFTYNLPIDDDFSHIQVWRNGVIVADNVKINSFNDAGLDYETTYNYVFKSVDMSGNVSNGSSLTVKTMPYVDDIAPLAVAGVDAVQGNASLSLSWFASSETDVMGYNVYVDGVKKNGSPVVGNSYRMTNLVNGQEYQLQVTAVDTSGNESELSQIVVRVPDANKLPVFKIDSDLTAVAESTENWFSELWLVTAFSASIPLAFIVGNRVKSLFFA